MAKLISDRDKIHDTSVYFVCLTVSSSGDLPAMCTITLTIDTHTHTHSHIGRGDRHNTFAFIHKNVNQSRGLL